MTAKANGTTVDTHQLLNILSELSHRSGDLPAYLQGVVKGMSTLLGLDWSVVTLCRGDSETLLASSLDIGEAMDQTYPLHGTVTQTVVTHGCPLQVADLEADASQGVGAPGYRAYLGVPLKLPNGEILGTVCSFELEPRQFTEEEVKLAEIFAERAAIAIDNHQLFNKQSQLNAQLRASEARFRALVEQATDAFYVLDCQGNIVEVNQQATAQLGYDREAFLTMNLADLHAVRDAVEMTALLKQAQPGQPVTIEGQHRAQAGHTIPVEISLSEIELDGDAAYLGLVRDICDRKQAQAATERLAEVGELASMIVHEVRNPLTTVWMAMTAMQQEALSPRSQNRLTFAVEEAQRLQTLLNDILLYAKPEQTLTRDTVDLNQLLSTLMATLVEQPNLANRLLHWTPTPVPMIVTGDSDKLKQVFINLITNACEAVDAGDKITCWIESLPTCDPITGHHITVNVHNGGTPIPADLLPQLTNPFFTTKSSGNGLGLAITKRIVESHRGQLLISSTADQGTQVSVLLPCVPSP
ncbi:MAG: PAS domain S-box protein [Cyanobacteria bacterium P01_A01_bin.105]